tara:strand:- start:170 stop:694 length:525 start_codon:yes stop_codon:yes gene_type:complete
MPAKKQTKKRAKKTPAKKAAKAFDQALLPPSQQGVPTLEDNFDVDSFDENAPPDLSKVEVNVVGGDSVSLEEADKDLLQVAPITLPEAETPPPVDNVPEKPVKAPVAVVSEQEAPFTWNEASVIVLSLIDGLNYLHPHAKRRIKGKDTPILMKRVERGRKLAAQMKSYASEKES